MGCGCGGPQFTPEDLDHELPSEADMARFGEGADDLARCTDCGEEMYDDAERCPACGAYQIRGGHAASAAAQVGDRLTGGSRAGRAIVPIAIVLVVAGLLVLTIF